MNSRTSRLLKAALRQGISVLEVLIAIGVATIGLLGVIAMIPYGANQAKLARIQDRAAQVGRNAFREFEVRKMSDPNTWRGSTFASGTPHFQGVTRTNYVSTSFRDSFGTFYGDTSGEYLRAFCIDPRFVAEYSTFNGTSTSPNRGFASANYAFPYPGLDTGIIRPAPSNDRPNADANIVHMQRISLAAAGFISGGVPRIMRLEQADAIFISPDDVRFARPGDDAPVLPLSLDDKTLPPFQLNDAGNGWNPANATTARSSDGEFSWMATLVPNAETGPGRAMYTLTVVVFYKRELVRDFDNERVVDILHGTSGPPANAPYSTFFGGGIGGGDVGLVCRRTFPNPPTYRADDVNVKRGDWVMLTRLSAFTSGTTPVPRPTLHRWYKVIAVDAEIASANSTTVTNYDGPVRPMRYVTLQGPDWPYVRSNNTFMTQVTIVKNVVAVFEKTVRLETSSPWRN